jgi:hypothetical protein
MPSRNPQILKITIAPEGSKQREKNLQLFHAERKAFDGQIVNKNARSRLVQTGKDRRNRIGTPKRAMSIKGCLYG